MPSLADEILALVEIPSVTGAEREIADRLEARLRGGAAGTCHELRRLGDSLIALPRDLPLTPRGSDGRPWIVLAGHLDTVPLGECGPPARRDGWVHGRGSADMKAGLAVMLRLLEELPPSDGFASRVYVFYAGEEGPAEENALRELLAREAWLAGADLAILLEPTGGALELGCQGSLHLEVEFRGRACHSARPWLGEHPLRWALPWMKQVQRIPPREATIAGVVFREVASITKLHAGEARNVIPGSMLVNLNLRYPPDRTPEEAEAYARKLAPLSEVASARIVDHAPPGAIPLEAPLYRHLLDTTGLPRRAKQAWTDVARFSTLGVPALNWGPGEPEAAHTREESVEVAQAERCLEGLRDYLLSSGPGRR